MKRKNIFTLIVLTAIALLMAFNMNFLSDKVKLSDVSLDNVEALAQESDEPDCTPVRGICFKDFVDFNFLAFQ